MCALCGKPLTTLYVVAVGIRWRTTSVAILQAPEGREEEAKRKHPHGSNSPFAT